MAIIPTAIIRTAMIRTAIIRTPPSRHSWKNLVIPKIVAHLANLHSFCQIKSFISLINRNCLQTVIKNVENLIFGLPLHFFPIFMYDLDSVYFLKFYCNGVKNQNTNFAIIDSGEKKLYFQQFIFMFFYRLSRKVETPVNLLSFYFNPDKLKTSIIRKKLLPLVITNYRDFTVIRTFIFPSFHHSLFSLHFACSFSSII